MKLVPIVASWFIELLLLVVGSLVVQALPDLRRLRSYSSSTPIEHRRNPARDV